MKNNWATIIREAINEDKRTLYRFSKDSGVKYQTLHRFFYGEREKINIETAEKLAAAVGLELRPARKGEK
jgi:hypothetical protein